MNYLISRDKVFYFNRRIPRHIQEYDPRKFVRFSLNTDSKTQAQKAALEQNAKLEQYWQKLINSGRKHHHDYYKQVVDRSLALGFSYIPNNELANQSLDEICDRLFYLEKRFLNEKQTEAVLGGISAPIIKLDDVWIKYLELNNDLVLTKSPHQIRIWKNPRQLAMKNLISCIGNKSVAELKREDLLKFRDWWIARIEKEGLTPVGANKNFIQTKTMIKRVCEEYKIKLDISHIYSKLQFDYDSETRPPFTTDHILNVLLKQENLRTMNDPHRSLLYVFAETGACFEEQLGLIEEDIVLDCDIPYISIRPRPKNKLKTKYRKRIIPLVGFALDVFKKYPKGFLEHIKNPDSASSSINKYLRENDLLPSDKHSVYSLRHSFQDRLLSIRCPDRVQADLMGHKFQRPVYGEGGSLKQRQEYMQKIMLKPIQ